jgi:hypothetical protein
MARRLLGFLAVVITGLVLWTVYANVIKDDAPVRAEAERVARDRAGCGSACKLTRMEGNRGAFNEQIQFVFDGKPPLLVECSRPYIGFGAYTCK